MRVSKNDTVCGLAAPAARQLMRAYFNDRPVDVACDILGVSQDAARDQMRAFEAAGYVEPGGMAHAAGDDWWVTTVKGNALANASFGKPISRATATRLLGQVIERARAYNADPARLLTVAEIVVFGSYLDHAVDPLGDLDLAVSTVRRDTDGKRHVDKVLEYARASGRNFSAFHDRLFWPARELRMILKNRSPAISITDEDIRKLTERSRSSMPSPTTRMRSLHPRTQWPVPDQPGVGASPILTIAGVRDRRDELASLEVKEVAPVLDVIVPVAVAGLEQGFEGVEVRRVLVDLQSPEPRDGRCYEAEMHPECLGDLVIGGDGSLACSSLRISSVAMACHCPRDAVMGGSRERRIRVVHHIALEGANSVERLLSVATLDDRKYFLWRHVLSPVAEWTLPCSLSLPPNNNTCSNVTVG